MKTLELKEAIENNKIIYTTAVEFLKSPIMWNEGDIDPEDYMVEICFADDEMMVIFVKCEEFFSKVYNTDFSESITAEDCNVFTSELFANAEIFELKTSAFS